jgi:hypothetical protein
MMNLHPNTLAELEPGTADFYRQTIQILCKADVPFLVGGAYALAVWTGIVRHTKDFDLFVRPRDCTPALEALAQAGYRTEFTFTHWLGKAFRGEDYIDVIFSSGNGIARVDDEWFAHARAAEVLGLPVHLCPLEETIWSKGFVMERERYDGADIAHLIRAHGQHLDWQRLLRRYGADWRVLLGHLVLFGYIYPGERSKIPAKILQDLMDRQLQDMHQQTPPERLCQGTLLSRGQYLTDIEHWGYQDARAQPKGRMTESQIAEWTNAMFAGRE